MTSGPELERVVQVISARLGLYFPPNRSRELLLGLTRAAQELGIDTPGSVGWVLSGELPESAIDALARQLTVGETYFFREQAVFDALRSRILPELLRPPSGFAPALRIWSAGCCTGEEPYSIAMLLDDLVPDWQAFKPLLLATDLNPQFLLKAQAAEYKQWSFRNTAPELKERFFESSAPQTYRLSSRIRERVRFERLNLIDDCYPSRARGVHDFHVILCRNVLMYFAPETARAVILRLRECLVPGGHLLVSPTETSQRLFEGFEVVHFGDAIAYRRPDAAASIDSKSKLPASEPAPIHPRALRARAPRRSPPAQRARAPRAESPAGPLELARSVADQGELARALEVCDRAVAEQRLDAALHHLRAAVLIELGRREEAGKSLETALYLDPEFVLAHFTLGHLAWQQQQPKQARRHFSNVLSLLEGQPASTLLPEADGLTALGLAELTRSLLAKLA